MRLARNPSFAFTMTIKSISYALFGLALASAGSAQPVSDTITIGSGIFTINPTNIVIDGTTIAPGAAAVTIDGKPVGADPEGDLYVGSAEVMSAPPSATFTGPTPTCLADGAPWFSPTSWCDCGASATYAAMSVSTGITGDASSSAMCAYTSLPTSTIQPISTTAAPTNIPGKGGLPGCAAVVWGPAHMDCPYASGINYCNCGGTFAPPLTTSGVSASTINCDYTLQPTANNCPVNTAYSASLSSAAAASDASVAAAASSSAAAVASASSALAASATPTGPSKCYPSHDLTYNSQTNYDLLTEVHASDLQGYCSGTNANWVPPVGGPDQEAPAANNYVQHGVNPAPSAPAACGQFYAQGHGIDVTTLCAAPLQRILSDCPYNGGENTNVCGTFWLQTCPFEINCPQGSPGG